MIIHLATMYTVITLKNASKHRHYPIFKKYIHVLTYTVYR